MIDNLKRIREPLAWAVIAIVAASIILGVVQLVIQLMGAVPVPIAFQEIGTNLMNVSLVLAAIAAVCICFFIAPATRRALLVTRVAAWVLTVGTVLTLVSWILGIAASANTLAAVLEFLGGFLDLLIKVLASGALWVLLRGVNAGRIDTAIPATAAVSAEPPVATTWQREDAAGAVWRTADEAASGAPGTKRIEAEATASDPVSDATER